ncbi:MAG: NAD-dependent deacetylase [Actinomycetota bacterium]|nr:NAD-dependent deacetylase [Actinomycetota bacterium]
MTSDDLEHAKRMIDTARSITVFTGAGISTDSGIPDFRGPNGVWTKNPAAEKASNLQTYLADPDVRRLAWQNRLHSPAWTAVPNSGHLAIYELERQGRLRAVVTQNIDELHQRAGHHPDKVIEVHGTMRWSRCWTCSDRRPMPETLERVRAGEDDPHCVVCAERGVLGILKSDTVSFGQSLVPEVIDAAMRAADECDLLLAAGSSLSVFPAANVVPRAKAGGAPTVIINAEPTGMDRFADVVLLGSLGDLLPSLIR